MHKNESPAHGAIREIAEELGINIEAEELLALAQPESSSGLMRKKHYFFLVRLAESPLIKLQKIEIAEVRWFSKAELAGLNIKVRHKQIIYDAGTG